VKNRILAPLFLIVIGIQMVFYGLLTNELREANALVKKAEEKASEEIKKVFIEADNIRQKLEEEISKTALLQKELEDADKKINLLKKELFYIRAQNKKLIEQAEQTEQIEKTEQVRIISRAQSSKNRVAITIDDGWDPSMVRRALEILQEKQAKATFFIVGNMIPKNSQTIKEAVEYGIEMGNHTQTHAHLTSLDEQGIFAELRGWENAMEKVLGRPYQATFFRPPGMAGFTTKSQSERFGKIISSHGYKIALWSVDTFYGIYREKGFNVCPQEIADYVIRNSKGGSIILLHFIPPDIRALALIIDGLRKKGLELVTLSKLIS